MICFLPPEFFLAPLEQLYHVEGRTLPIKRPSDYLPSALILSSVPLACLFRYTVVHVLVLFTMVAAAFGSTVPSYNTPAPTYNAPAPSYRAPSPSYNAPASSGPAQYDFNYAVRDDYSGNDYSHQENRNGYDSQGAYYVLLPDGRVQRVAYTVNGDSGYVAEVTYEGEAQYPAYQPAPSRSYQPAPAPSYQPAPTPAYQTTPSYA
ncbi:cuticle protein 18.6-like [Penaeus chinensis]|uniref:cuticle protein 18.6-like n=1 Tax=Penaeus chinensis TaxID=139456 RepID=UPI001FB813C7|nr:cuticle protein 18.6-like [Penaeus chinensis]